MVAAKGFVVVVWQPPKKERRKQLEQCITLLDEAELSNDTHTFQQVLDTGGVALLAKLRKSDFDYPRFEEWCKHNKQKRQRWFVLFSADMCSQPMHELKLASEALKQNPGARMQRFNSKQLAKKLLQKGLCRCPCLMWPFLTDTRPCVRPLHKSRLHALKALTIWCRLRHEKRCNNSWMRDNNGGWCGQARSQE